MKPLSQSRFRKNSKPPSPDVMRRELMGQKLPAEKIGEIATLAATRIKDDETIPPEVAEFTEEYLQALHHRMDGEANRLGTYALIDTTVVMIGAGWELERKYGNPLLGDFVHDQTGLVDGANAVEARLATEYAMGQVFYDINHPSKHQH